ncbi:hypothetical protein AKO1_007793, partial [Acrasis kona]
TTPAYGDYINAPIDPNEIFPPIDPDVNTSETLFDNRIYYENNEEFIASDAYTSTSSVKFSHLNTEQRIILGKLKNDPHYDQLSPEELAEKSIEYSDVNIFNEKYLNYTDLVGTTSTLDSCDHEYTPDFLDMNHLIEGEGEPVLKVKFIITDVKSKPNKHVRSATTKLLRGIRRNPKYGVFHSAFCVGPKIVEWSKASVCVVRSTASSSAIIAVDVAEYRGEAAIRNFLYRLSEIVVEWNKSHWFGWGRQKNCQFYVEDTFQRLGIKLCFNDQLQSYIKTLRNKGRCDAMLVLDDELRSLLGVQNKRIKFKTHEELDIFAHKLFNENEVFMDSMKGVQLLQLMKVFDRAFWMRYLRDKGKEQYAPCSCPFGDPRRTHTQWNIKALPKQNNTVLPKK